MIPGERRPLCILCDAVQRDLDKEAEQAFWDACVAAMVGNFKFAARYLKDEDIDQMGSAADRLLDQRRKRIAARAKGG